jgi:hypothetical protein
MPVSTRDLSGLPDVTRLEQLSQSIAMLDAIISPEWEYRYFSFNSKWDPSKQERMASMRNGSGDEYFLLFSPQGGILKGFDHEAAMSPWTQEPKEVWPGILNHVPAIFGDFLAEPAFSLGNTTFCIWRTNHDERWQVGSVSFPPGNDPDGSENLLWMLDGDPETYASFANEYYEKMLNVDLVRRLYLQTPLTPALVSDGSSFPKFS